MSIINPIKTTILLVIMLISNVGFCQYFSGQAGYWKTKRHSFGVGIGATNFLGELGGLDKVGSGFINDLEFSETKPSINISYRYQINSILYARANFLYGMLSGNDNLTEEPFRKNRNIHFRSNIYELSAQLEVNILDFTDKSQHQARINRGFFSGSSLYAFAGVGALRFNPQAKFNNTWYDLKPLGTEGQNQLGGPEEYSLFTVVFPVGLGFRWEANNQWSFGLEGSYRITLTDYIDDVSTVYFDNDQILQNQGEIAAYFADPSLGVMENAHGDVVPLNSTFTGAQRGDSEDNDAYITLHVTAVYKIAQKRYKKHRGKITRRKKRKIVF